MARKTTTKRTSSGKRQDAPRSPSPLIGGVLIRHEKGRISVKVDRGLPHVGRAIEAAFAARLQSLRKSGREDQAQRLAEVFDLCAAHELGVVFTVRQAQPSREALIAGGSEFVESLPVDRRDTFWHNAGNDTIVIALMPWTEATTILQRHGVVRTPSQGKGAKLFQSAADSAVARQIALRGKKGEDGKQSPGKTARRSLAKPELRPSSHVVDLSTVDMPRWDAFCESLSSDAQRALHPLAKQLEKELQGMAGMSFSTDDDAERFTNQLRARLDELHVRIACLGDDSQCRHPSYLAFQRWGNSPQFRFKCEHAPAIGGKRYHGESSRELPLLSLVPAQPHPLRK